MGGRAILCAFDRLKKLRRGSLGKSYYVTPWHDYSAISFTLFLWGLLLNDVPRLKASPSDRPAVVLGSQGVGDGDQMSFPNVWVLRYQNFVKPFQPSKSYICDFLKSSLSCIGGWILQLGFSPLNFWFPLGSWGSICIQSITRFVFGSEQVHKLKMEFNKLCEVPFYTYPSSILSLVLNMATNLKASSLLRVFSLIPSVFYPVEILFKAYRVPIISYSCLPLISDKAYSVKCSFFLLHSGGFRFQHYRLHIHFVSRKSHAHPFRGLKGQGYTSLRLGRDVLLLP